MGAVDPFKAPVVSSLSVRVVVDSVFDQFMPKATHPMCTIEHVGRIRSNLNSTLAGEWGLSLHLESRSRRRDRAIPARFWLHPRNPDAQFRPARHRARVAQRADSQPRAPRPLRWSRQGLSRFTGTVCATICACSPAARRPFARNGSGRATKSRPRGERSTAPRSKPPTSRRFTVRPPMRSTVRSRLAISRASLSKGYLPNTLVEPTASDHFSEDERRGTPGARPPSR